MPVPQWFKKWPGLTAKLSISVFAFIGGSDSRLMDENHCNCLITTRQKLKTRPIAKNKKMTTPHLLTWPNLFEISYWDVKLRNMVLQVTILFRHPISLRFPSLIPTACPPMFHNLLPLLNVFNSTYCMCCSCSLSSLLTSLFPIGVGLASQLLQNLPIWV